MLKNAPTLAIVAVHTAENELPQVLKKYENVLVFKSRQESRDAVVLRLLTAELRSVGDAPAEAPLLPIGPGDE